MRRVLAALVAVTMLAVVVVTDHPRAAASTANWPTYLFNNQHSSYNPSAGTITPSNTSQLTPAWTFIEPSNVSPPSRLYASPTVYDGKIYIGSNSGQFYRLDEATGAVDWHENLGTSPALTCRAKGIISTAAVAPDPVSGELMVYIGAGDGQVDALRASDGFEVWHTPVNVDSATQNDKYNFSSPLVDRGRVYEGISSSCDQPLTRGGLVELGQSTGALLHTYYTVPEGSVGGSIWSSPAITADGSTVFVTTGNGDETAGADQGDSISIVKLDANTLAKEDIWTAPVAVPNDSDFGGSPTLFSANLNGVSTPMVGALNKKGGYYYAMKQSNLAAGPVWAGKIGHFNDVAAAIWDGTHLFTTGGGTKIGGIQYPGSVRELNPATGAAVWITGITGGGVGFGSPTMDGGGVIGVVSYDATTGASNAAYLLSASDGTLLRTISLTSPTFAQPVFADQYLFVADGTAAHLSAYAAPTSTDTDFSVEQGVSANPVGADDDLTYTITVRNSGADAAATLTDTPPSDVRIGAITPSQGTCSGTAPITCSLGQIAQGGDATVQLVVTPIAPGTISNTASVNPSDSTPTDNTSTLMTSVSAQPSTRYVTVDDSGFTPSTAIIRPGVTLQWSFYSAGHSAKDGALLGCSVSPCALFDSGTQAALDYYQQVFAAAGKYPVVDSGSSNKGTISVITKIAPLTGTTADTFTITWASHAAGANQAYDVQIREPGTSVWTSWQTKVSVPSGTFDSSSPAWVGAGQYHFRARLWNTSTNNHTAYSTGSPLSVS
jgi:uncharacterized repeat protein (TIGR01451 family)